ncbi:UNVERIFIED_CONTAM: hypothetical protein GTU68_017522 [Idotea baltica]|nr:hypothetical protein [Idotea baltica]
MLLLESSAFSLVTPDWGLVAWTTIIFVLLWFILGKFAFKPIAKSLKDREESINDALSQAEQAREEIAILKADNDKILKEAREERAQIVKEAKEQAKQIIDDASEKAKSEISKKHVAALAEISNQKLAAIMEVKNMIGAETVRLAEGVLSRELNDKSSQESFIASEVSKINLN